MASSPQQATDLQRISLAVSKDKLTATIQMRTKGDNAPVKAEEVTSALALNKIAVNDFVKKRIAEFVEQSTSEAPTKEAFIIARGRKLKDGHDEELVWDESFEKEAAHWQDDSPVNYYEYNTIVTVEEGTLVGTISPAVQPVPGCDVFGEVIPPTAEPRAFEIDDETIQTEAGERTKVYAKTAGRVVEKNMRLAINQVLMIPGDVEFKTGNIDSATDVHIKGTINDKFEVKSRKSVTIRQAVQAANVIAEGDVTVRGGILGRDLGRVVSGGEVVAKFGAEAFIQAEGDIRISKELMNSHTRTNGKLIAAHASIIGGVQYARNGGEIGTAGSEANVATRIAIGIDPLDLLDAAEIDEKVKPKLKNIQHIRSTVQPLMANVKRLTNAQKEQATELLFKADELEMEIQESKDRAEKIHEEAANLDSVQLVVAGQLFPGTVIVVGDRIAPIQKELKGPVSIEKRKVKNVTEIVAINKLTGSITVLPSARPPIEEVAAPFAAKPMEEDSSDDEKTSE